MSAWCPFRRVVPIVAVLTALAGPVPAAQPGPRGQPPPAMRVGEVQRLFDDLIVRQARQRLGLRPDQVGPFTDRLRALQTVRRRGIAERARLLAELARLSAPGTGDEGALAARLDDLAAFEAEQVEALREAYAALDAVLDLTQRARFRVLEEQLERRKLELITRARRQDLLRFRE